MGRLMKVLFSSKPNEARAERIAKADKRVKTAEQRLFSGLDVILDETGDISSGGKSEHQR
jgi:hypothetical protein